MLSDRCPVCPVCLSVTLVYCGQTVGWIKMKLGMRVGLGPGHIVLDGDPAPSPPKGGGDPQYSAPICCAKWLYVGLAQMGDRLATIDMGRKLGALPLWGSWVPI